jgi:uncharacterized protein YndB with AHSA1/START domain
MLPVEVHTFISAPREEIFDLIVDMAYRVAWTDHYASDFHLASARAIGVGAAARYRLDAPFYNQWVETQIVDAERPSRVVEQTRAGRSGRTRGEVRFELFRQGRSVTRVAMTTWSEPGTPREAVMEKLAARRWLRRQSRTALERLRTIFEERPDRPLARAGVAGWEASKAPRFGLHPGTEPGEASG